MVSQLGPHKVICYLKLDQLYQATTWTDKESNDVINMLQTSNFDILQIFEFMSLALNLFLCMDIVLTMRNPFYPHDRRMKYYLPLSVFFAFIGFTFSLKRLSKQHVEGEEEEKINMHERALFSVAFLSFYIVFAVTSVAYAWRVNTRPGMSSEVRKEFATRHFFYVTSYILTWLPFFGFSYFILYATTLSGHDLHYQDLVTNETLSK